MPSPTSHAWTELGWLTGAEQPVLHVITARGLGVQIGTLNGLQSCSGRTPVPARRLDGCPDWTQFAGYVRLVPLCRFGGMAVCRIQRLQQRFRRQGRALDPHRELRHTLKRYQLAGDRRIRARLASHE